MQAKALFSVCDVKNSLKEFFFSSKRIFKAKKINFFDAANFRS
jgi:hypothetical protein